MPMEAPVLAEVDRAFVVFFLFFVDLDFAVGLCAKTTVSDLFEYIRQFWRGRTHPIKSL